jgi:hypothetical protein
LVLAGLTFFRWVYFGEWLPNTYYLKLGGISPLLRISLGIKLLVEFVWNSNWILILVPLLVAVLDRRKTLLVVLAALVSQVAYSVYVGGDSWESIGGANRFIATVMPLHFVLLVLAIEKVINFFADQVSGSQTWKSAAAGIVLIVATGLSLLNLNSLLVRDGLQKWTLQEKPPFTSSVERYTGMGIKLAEVTTPEATIAVVTAGIIPYFAERTSIDILGKNDPVIAHSGARINSSLFSPGNFRPGHNKWDYAYSIGELQPDVVAQTWENTDEEVAPFLVNYAKIVVDGIPYYFREGSLAVRWDLLPPAE